MSGTGLNSNSMQQWVNNTSFIGGVAMAGFLLVTLVLFSLHNAGMESWYVLTLSACAVAISGITVVSANKLQPTGRVSTRTSPQCGGNQLPSLYCNDRYHEDTGTGIVFIYGGGSGASIFCCVVMVLLAVDTGTIFKKTTEHGDTLPVNGYVLLRDSMKSRTIWGVRVSSMMRISTAMFLMAVECLFLYWIASTVESVSYLMHSTSGGDNNWSFGQIVAVTVWAPALIEWIYLASCKSGFVQHCKEPGPSAYQLMSRSM